MKRLLMSGLLLVVSASAATAGADSYFTEKIREFGTTPRGPVLVHYFMLTNTSGQELTIGRPRVSCGCVTATVLNPRLAPGQSTAVLAQMDTRRIPRAGELRTVTVYVPFLAPQLEEVQLRVTATARDDLVMTPETLAFGTVQKGQGGKATVRVTVYGNANWQVINPVSSGAYVKPSVAEVDRQGGQVTYEVSATVDPECPVGNWTADVWVESNAPGIERLRIPVTVAVVAPIAVKPEVLSFGDVKSGEKAEQRVIMQGSKPFRILEIQGDKTGLTVTPTSDDARPVHIVTISLDDPAVGAMTRNLTVVTDHAEQPKVNLAFTARVRE